MNKRILFVGSIILFVLISGCTEKTYTLEEILPPNINNVQSLEKLTQYRLDFEKLGLPTTMMYDYSRYDGYEEKGIQEIERPATILLIYSKKGYLMGSGRFHTEKKSFFNACRDAIGGLFQMEALHTGEVEMEGEKTIFCERVMSLRGLITSHYHIGWYDSRSGYYLQETISFSLGYEDMNFYNSNPTYQKYLRIVKEQVNENIRQIILKIKELHNKGHKYEIPAIYLRS